MWCFMRFSLPLKCCLSFSVGGQICFTTGSAVNVLLSAVNVPPPLFSLSDTRAKVWKARTTSTLFDVRQYCKDLEDLFYKIWQRVEQGLPPDHIMT